MYWIPLIRQKDGGWTGIACPLPLQKVWSHLFFINNSYCKFSLTDLSKDEIYELSYEKIFTTPKMEISGTTEPSVYLQFDKTLTKKLINQREENTSISSLSYVGGLSSSSHGVSPRPLGVKISLAGRLKGISKAKKLVISHGVLKAQSLNLNLDYYARPIYTKWGTIGLKVITKSF